MIRSIHVVFWAATGPAVQGCSTGSDSGAQSDSAARPPAPAAGSVCARSRTGVTTIERPIFPDRADSPTFGYSFKVYPGTDPNAPTVIYLPGGPGGSSISEERGPEYVPEAYTIVQTDPRGVGCNAAKTVDHYSDEFYETEWFASDVLAIVQRLRLTNYLLYGVSYGSLLATVTASKAEAEGITPPVAVVLEGVVGKTFDQESEVEEMFQSEWRALRDRLPEDVRTELLSTPPPLGLSADDWGGAISTMLSVGTFRRPYSFGEELLLALSAQASSQDREGLRKWVARYGGPPFDEFGMRLHDLVACHEVVETDFVSLSLRDGELVASSTYCTDVPLDRAYAARDWPITKPIYYFSGKRDPNTPSWQAQAHFDAEVTAPRELVSVPDAGHQPLALNLEDCAAPLWAAMAGGKGLKDALSGCEWPTELTSATAK